MEKIQERIDQLRKEILRNKSIYEGLKDYAPFKMLLEDYETTIKQADSSWFLLNLDDKQQLSTFNQLRAIKLAGMQLMNTVETYKYNIQRATAELEELENTEGDSSTKTVNSYYEQE